MTWSEYLLNCRGFVCQHGRVFRCPFHQIRQLSAFKARNDSIFALPCLSFLATPGINYRKKYVTSTAVLVALSLLCAPSFTLEMCEMHIFGLPNPTMLRAFLAN